MKVTDEYAAWFTALIKEDLGSGTLVAQAVAALREDGPSLGRLWTGSRDPGSITSRSCGQALEDGQRSKHWAVGWI